MSDTRPGAVLAKPWHGRPVALWLLIALLVTLGLRGVAGGTALLLDPSDGSIGLTPGVLRGTPLRDFALPGSILLTAFGAAPLLAAERLWRGASSGRLGATAIGVALVVWVIVEAFVLGFGQRLQVPNLLTGLVVALLAHSRAVRSHVSDSGGSER